MKRFFLLICIIILFTLLNNPIVHGANSSNIYEVKQGDTLPKIAKIHQTTIKELKASNGLQSNSLIKGQKLWVPFIYEVQIGDTLEELATKYHSTTELIKTTNHLSSKQLIPGQLLKIPPKKMQIQGQHIIMTMEDFKGWLFHHEFQRDIQLIQHHHTWTPSYKRFSGSNHFELLSGMEKHHKKQMGWSNIAQNITIFPDGKIAVSRPLDTAPEGTIGPIANKNGLTIENIGNFDIGQDEMTKEQKEAIVYVTALLSIKFDLIPSIDSITYHHWWHLKTGERVLDEANDYEVKTCPGTNFFGGNTTKSARENFYPLVKQKMEEVLTSDREMKENAEV